jgi:hypothetical protein
VLIRPDGCEAERPRYERRDSGRVGHPVADRIIAAALDRPLGNRIDLDPAEHVITWRIRWISGR